MEKHGDEIDVTEEEASGGEKSNVVRYVLAVSLFLTIAALSIIWITGAMTSDASNDSPRSETQKSG